MSKKSIFRLTAKMGGGAGSGGFCTRSRKRIRTGPAPTKQPAQAYPPVLTGHNHTNTKIQYHIYRRYFHEEVYQCIRSKANGLALRARMALSNQRGDFYISDAVKIIIAVVLGALLLAALTLIFNDTVIPRITQEIEGLFGAAN